MHIVRNRKAFTVMELLVVITIIVIITGLLLPVFTRSRYAAKESVCISNLHQSFLAIELYSNDYDGKFPWAQPRQAALVPYFGGTDLVCPIAAGKPDQLRHPFGDYLNVSALAPLPVGAELPPSVIEYRLKWQECRDIRGSEFPVVIDTNHLSAIEQVESGRGLYIFVRASGSAEKVPDKRQDLVDGSPMPCDPILLHLNF